MTSTDPGRVDELPTPALVVDRPVFEANLATMSAARPGGSLRPHIKAFKSTAIVQRLLAAGHDRFCAATIRELEGVAQAGIEADLLLANEVVDCSRLGRLAADGHRITVAVDSPETVRAAAAGGVRDVLIDVEVGLPRCGCAVEAAGPLADAARAAGLTVRGVMGYEGHLMMVADPAERTSRVERSMTSGSSRCSSSPCAWGPGTDSLPSSFKFLRNARALAKRTPVNPPLTFMDF